MKSIEIESILSQVKKLDYNARVYLLKQITRLLKKENPKTEYVPKKLTELNNLGREIWNDIDIDEYVKKERQWD